MFKLLAKIRKLSVGDSICINAVVYIKQSDERWKVCPFGLVDNFNKASYYVSSEHLVDELVNTIDLTKPVIFKQDSPKDQSVAILQGIEGFLLNLKDGKLSDKKSIDKALLLVRQMKALSSWLSEGW